MLPLGDARLDFKMFRWKESTLWFAMLLFMPCVLSAYLLFC